MVIALAPQTPPECAFNALVPVTGVDVRELGRELAGQWVTDYLRVEGVWTDGAIAANSVSSLELPRATEILSPLGSPGVPCEPPSGGWSRYPDGPDGERAAAALEAEVESHPEKYSGLWTGAITDSNENPVDLVVVVGTVADVESVAADLRALYPFNLCVTHVDYSRGQLEGVIESLSAGFADWDVTLDPSIARIVVRLPAFDPRAAEATAPYESEVVVLPVVEAPLATRSGDRRSAAREASASQRRRQAARPGC